MSPEILERKLADLRHFLADFEAYRDATLADVLKHHYTVERIFSLLVVSASKIVSHLLMTREIYPHSYRNSFQLAAAEGLLSADLTARLLNAAEMRENITWQYDSIDYEKLHAAIPLALDDFSEFVAIFAARAFGIPEDTQ